MISSSNRLWEEPMLCLLAMDERESSSIVIVIFPLTAIMPDQVIHRLHGLLEQVLPAVCTLQLRHVCSIYVCSVFEIEKSSSYNY